MTYQTCRKLILDNALPALILLIAAVVIVVAVIFAVIFAVKAVLMDD